MNYYGFALPVTGFFIDENLSASAFGRMLDERRGALPVPVAQGMQNLMDSHDTDRLASMVVNGENHGNPHHIDYNNANSAVRSKTFKLRKPDDRERAIQRLIALFQMTFVGAPMIYYGTEAGMWGGHDPDVRMPMVWADMKFAPQATDPRGGEREPDDVNFDPALYEFYKGAIALRRSRSALSLGEYRQLGAFDDRKVFVFERSFGDDALLVAINRGDAPQTVDVPLSSGLALAEARPLFVTRPDQTGGVSLTAGATTARITLPPLTGAVFGKPSK